MGTESTYGRCASKYNFAVWRESVTDSSSKSSSVEIVVWMIVVFYHFRMECMYHLYNKAMPFLYILHVDFTIIVLRTYGFFFIGNNLYASPFIVVPIRLCQYYISDHTGMR